MVLSSQSRTAWLDIRNKVEALMAPGECFFSVPEFAGRIANNVARMAANWQFFQHGNTEISSETLATALETCTWHAAEFLRMFSEEAEMPEPEMDAIILEKTLRKWYANRGVWNWDVPNLQKFVPRPLRYNKSRLMGALLVLANKGGLTITKTGTSEVVQLTTYFNSPQVYEPQTPLLQSKG